MRSRMNRTNPVFRSNFCSSPQNSPDSSLGMSLIEVMVVVALIVILAMLFYWYVPTYLQRAHDSRRKADLHEYRTVMEEYFTDKHRYPPSGSLDNCGSLALEPYLDRIHCDPQTRTPYAYFVSEDGLRYWLYTYLTDPNDPIIGERGCALGCGPDGDGDGHGDYNYGVSSQQVVSGEFVQQPGAPPNCPSGCIPNSCGTCCPGARNRCDSIGTSCYTDLTCP